MIQLLKTQKGLSEKDKQATTALTSLQTADAFYLFCFGLLEGKLDGGHSQLVGKEAHVSGQLWWADVGSWAVPTTNAAQELPLEEREKK